MVSAEVLTKAQEFQAMIANPVTWMIACFVLFLFVIILIMVLMAIKKRTHAFKEWKAYRKKIPLLLMFNDDNTVEWILQKPEAGMIMDKKYGAFIISPTGNYLDRTTNNILIPFSSSVGVSIPAKFAQMTDAIGKVVGDERKMSILRKRIMEGKMTEKQMSKLSFLKESINFSKVKSMLNNISPHNIDAKINLMVSRKLGSFGKDQMMLLAGMLVIGLALIALFAFVYNAKQNPQTAIRIVNDGAQAIYQNASRIIS